MSEKNVGNLNFIGGDSGKVQEFKDTDSKTQKDLRKGMRKGLVHKLQILEKLQKEDKIFIQNYNTPLDLRAKVQHNIAKRKKQIKHALMAIVNFKLESASFYRKLKGIVVDR